MIRPSPETLTARQSQVVAFPREGGQTLYLRGLPGTGKTTALVARLAALLSEGRRPYEVLVLVPQRRQVDRYDRALSGLTGPVRGGVDVVTFYGLSRRAVDLFWPLVARPAGFASPDREPTFLTLETTQFFMWRIVAPLIADEGYFSDLTIRRERLLSQLIDNLNKSAVVGFEHTDICRRLRGAWTGSAEQINSYLQAQQCATRFRQYCLEHNLLDFSLATEVYCRHLLPNPAYRRYFRTHFRHLIVDNLEENVPVALDMVRWAIESCDSATLAYDEGGGYRVFLGADAQLAGTIEDACDRSIVFEELLESTGPTLAFAGILKGALGGDPIPLAREHMPARPVVGPKDGRYWISMISWVCDGIVDLVSGGVLAGKVAIVAPYVSEVMRFTVEEELRKRGVALFLLRPATSLRDEPTVRALLTLVILAHVAWRIETQGYEYSLPTEDVALALEVALADLDPIRARHLAKAAVPFGARELVNLSGAADTPRRDLGRLWESVGFEVRDRYEALRTWLEDYAQGDLEPVDIFLTRLFGDLLSRPGYGFFARPDRARAYGRLVESAKKFGEAVGQDRDLDDVALSREYVQLILGGIASAQYLLDWPQSPPTDAVVLTPAYAYLTRDLSSDYQFWIDLGSDGWWNRPNQPLTHPHVLSRRWPEGRPWRDVDEEAVKRETLGRLVQGLAARCRKEIYLAFSELGVNGSEQGGRLQKAAAVALTRLSRHV